LDADLREMREEMRAGQQHLKEEIMAKLDACHERMMARMDSWLEKMEGCLGKTETTDLEANSGKIESEVEHEEVPEEQAAEETFGALKKYWDQHLAVGYRG
jgi:hypothetical protein